MKNFLIVKLSAIGDVIHALPAAYALKETYPDCHITWVVEPPAYDLVNMSPYIDEIILFEKKKFKTFRGFLREYGPFLAAGVLFSLPVPELLRDKLHVSPNLMKIVGSVCLLALTFISITYIAVGSYNPFIYFNF